MSTDEQDAASSQKKTRRKTQSWFDKAIQRRGANTKMKASRSQGGEKRWSI
jgi:hypothetical protein